MTDVGRIIYLCDRKACGEVCPNDECHHTMSLEHALHPDRDVSGFITRPSPIEGKVDLWEPMDA